MTARKLPRGRCPWCGRTRALDAGGRLRRHPDPNRPQAGAVCPGSGQRPAAVAGRAAPRALRQLAAPGMIRRAPRGQCCAGAPHECPGCRRVMSHREWDEQRACNDCAGAA